MVIVERKDNTLASCIVYAWHGASDTWTCVVYEHREPILVGIGRRLRDCIVDMALNQSDISDLTIVEV